MLAEKSLAQNLGRPTLIALAHTIERKRKDYYSALEHNNKDLEVTDWLEYFARTVPEAQGNTIKRSTSTSQRQSSTNVRLRLSLTCSGKALTALRASQPRTTSLSPRHCARRQRAICNLVEKGAVIRTGERRHTHYFLALD